MHTLKWYKENFGVSPVALGLPFVEKKNPYYSSGSPMKLWEEEDVLPFKSDVGIAKHQVRKAAGTKAYQTKKTNLIKWFESVKSEDPRVHEITHRLWEIGTQIRELHALKAICRGDGYDDYENEHCTLCCERTDHQNRLRDERAVLFQELIIVCGKDKRTIQLARKYCREEGSHK